jgi:hypothetical protein
VSEASVSVDYFDVIGAPPIAGRSFHSGDLAPARRVVIVNESFVRRVMRGVDPIGRQIRFVEQFEDGGEEEFEIIGVVSDLGMTSGEANGDGAGLYHPVQPEDAEATRLIVHTGGQPESFTSRLRTVAGEVDPALWVTEPLAMNRIGQDIMLTFRFWIRILALVGAIVMLLSAAGIYALTAFAVSRRTREMGVRLALGAEPRRLVATILARALAPVPAGFAAGVVIILLTSTNGRAASMLAPVSVGACVMLLAALAACIVPARRALGINPMETLRTDE